MLLVGRARTSLMVEERCPAPQHLPGPKELVFTNGRGGGGVHKDSFVSWSDVSQGEITNID